MGVRMLNRYLREYTQSAIKQMTLNDLKGKTIAVDVSILLYKFKGDDSLLENMYLMIKKFRECNITPVYVFDGTPPDEKNDVLNERDSSKKKAKSNCEAMQRELDENDNLNDNERDILIQRLKNEKKKCLRISNANVRDTKALMNVMGVPYLEAEGEADELCVWLVKKKFAWACLTEDMDMFVYGCPRVLRCFDLKKGTINLYDLSIILDNLNMTQSEFKEVCLLSGTDYNKSNFNIFTTMGFFYKYLKRKRRIIGFYNWLIFTRTITIDDKESLNRSKEMFNINISNEISDTISMNKLKRKRILMSELTHFIEKYQIKLSD